MPENLGETINSSTNEIEPYIAPDESFVIFAAAGRPDSKGALDLYISHQKDGKWSKPENLGEPINSSGWDFSPKISPDGKYFLFASNRGFADKAPGEEVDLSRVDQEDSQSAKWFARYLSG